MDYQYFECSSMPNHVSDLGVRTWKAPSAGTKRLEDQLAKLTPAPPGDYLVLLLLDRDNVDRVDHAYIWAMSYLPGLLAKDSHEYFAGQLVDVARHNPPSYGSFAQRMRIGFVSNGTRRSGPGGLFPHGPFGGARIEGHIRSLAPELLDVQMMHMHLSPPQVLNRSDAASR